MPLLYYFVAIITKAIIAFAFFLNVSYFCEKAFCIYFVRKLSNKSSRLFMGRGIYYIIGSTFCKRGRFLKKG